MKPIKRLLIFFGICFFMSGCTKDPGPIPANMNRIKVECRGLATSQYISITNIGTSQIAQPGGGAQNLGCFFYDAVYFDLSAPPYSFSVNASAGNTTTDSMSHVEDVTFTGVGEQIVVKITSLIIGGSVSF